MVNQYGRQFRAVRDRLLNSKGALKDLKFMGNVDEVLSNGAAEN